MLFLKTALYTILLLVGIVASVSFASLYPQYALYYFATLSSLSALGLLTSFVGWAYYRQQLSNPIILIPLLIATAYASFTTLCQYLTPTQLSTSLLILLLTFAQTQHFRTSKT